MSLLFVVLFTGLFVMCMVFIFGFIGKVFGKALNEIMRKWDVDINASSNVYGVYSGVQDCIVCSVQDLLSWAVWQASQNIVPPYGNHLASYICNILSGYVL